MAATLAIPEPIRPTRWLHALAVLTVCATVPLLTLGAQVTTMGVGMVDERGFREPWHLLTLWLEGQGLSIGYVIEHSHRTFGFVVGICVIVLSVSLWLTESRRWVCWAGVAALAGVSVQGILGILRIDQNTLLGNTLALIHGCFAQLVFALLVSIALWTSRTWYSPLSPGGSRAIDSSPLAPLRGRGVGGEGVVAPLADLRKWSLTLAILIYTQVILGAIVRHKDFPLGARAHLLMAFVVVAALIPVVRLAFTSGDRPSRRCASLLYHLVALQIWLGIESWLSKFWVNGQPRVQVEPLSVHHEFMRSLHTLTGALIFATAVAQVWLAHRQLMTSDHTAPKPAEVTP